MQLTTPPAPREPEDEDAFQKATEALPENEDEIWPITRLYYKVGGYFKLTFREFLDTPWPVIKQVASLLDEKEGDMEQFIGYEEAALFKTLKRMFPKKD